MRASVPWWRDQSYYDEPGRGTYERDGGGVEYAVAAAAKRLVILEELLDGHPDLLFVAVAQFVDIVVIDKSHSHPPLLSRPAVSASA